MNMPQRPTEEILLAYLEGELLPAHARQVESYLASDPVLSRQVEGMKRDLAGLRSLPQVKPPASLMKGVLEHLDGVPGQRVNPDAIPISRPQKESKTGRRAGVFPLIALSSLAAAATVAVTFGVIYYTAENAPLMPDLPSVPMAHHPTQTPAAGSTPVRTETGTSGQNAGQQTTAPVKTQLAAAGFDVNRPELLALEAARMSEMNQEVQTTLEPFDPSFVIDYPRGAISEHVDPLLAMDTTESEINMASRAMHQIAATSRSRSTGTRPADSAMTGMIPASGAASGMRLDRPVAGVNAADVDRSDSEIANLPVKTMTVAFNSADRGQRALVEWALTHQVRVLNGAGQPKTALPATTREVRLLITQEQLDQFVSGITMAEGPAGVITGGTGSAMAKHAGASTAIASIVDPETRAGATTQPADLKNQPFVLQVQIRESNRR
jgi:hypothetical protein